MFRFDSDGNFKAAFDFGWDSTPAIYQHAGTYSVVIKDNHYDAGNYWRAESQRSCHRPFVWMRQRAPTTSRSYRPENALTIQMEHKARPMRVAETVNRTVSRSGSLSMAACIVVRH
jgi:hypothetical protein